MVRLRINGCHLRLSFLIKSTSIGAIVIGFLQPQFDYNSLGGAPKRTLYLPRFLANPAWGGLHSCDLSLYRGKIAFATIIQSISSHSLVRSVVDQQVR